jgi:hypothetical protein
LLKVRRPPQEITFSLMTFPDSQPGKIRQAPRRLTAFAATTADCVGMISSM